MTEDVKRIIERTLQHEGGYSFDKNDPGGETKYGISKRSYPSVDIKNLQLSGAVEIYESDYYNAMNLPLIDSARVRWKLFDIGINCGTHTAIKMLQNALHILPDDGILGPKTAGLVNVMDNSAVISLLCDAQKCHYRKKVIDNPKLGRYLNGWLARAEDKGENL